MPVIAPDKSKDALNLPSPAPTFAIVNVVPLTSIHKVYSSVSIDIGASALSLAKALAKETTSKPIPCKDPSGSKITATLVLNVPRL